MKVGKKEISYLFVALGLILVVGAFLYGNNLAGKTETLSTENASLETEVSYLQDLMEHKQEYLDETDRMSMEMEDIKAQFPAEIRPETEIMYANGLESKFDVLLNTVNIPGTEIVAVDSGVPEAVEEATAEDTEGATTDSAAADASGDALASSATSITLYKTETSLVYQASYKGLKDMIRYINEDTDRKSIDEFSLGFDESTGNLTGSVKLGVYALAGTGKEYQAPVVTGVTDGKTQIIQGGTTLNRNSANQAGDAGTADGKASSGTTTPEE
ncbi:MAG: hypothetical protein IJ711_12930 [Lachnospiraceae bacterium]|nr:hypothetical protein [Lachnospiraceae bacterium]